MTDINHCYLRDGFVGPLQVVPASHATAIGQLLRTELSQAEQYQQQAPELDLAERFQRYGSHGDALLATRNRHLDLAEVTAFVQQCDIVSTCELLLADQPVLWRSQLFVQTGLPDTGLGLHRDNYRGLLEDGEAQLSCQIALHGNSSDNCMVFLPGSHRWSDQRTAQHGLCLLSNLADDPYGTSRYEQSRPMPPGHAMPVLMQPGEAVFFHPRLIHGSSARMKMATTQSTPDRTPRVAITLRVAAVSNRFLPACFDQTLPRGDRPMALV